MFAATLSLTCSASLMAQDIYKAPPRGTAAPAETRQNSELSDELAALGSGRPSADPYIVESLRPFDGASLYTKKLVFKAGAKLVILRPRSGGTVRIRADEVVVEGPGAGIFWSRPPAPSTAPSDRGRAPSGSFGRAPGMSGSPGLDGEAGNPGFPGADAIDLVLAFGDISGADLDVDLRGSNGGPGGKGQDGGDGGAGSQGSSASSSFFGCKSGPGRGGDGGQGGRAGPGGQGGQGGRGGTLVVMTPDAADAKNLIHAFVGGGANGLAGSPGAPGSGGEAGPEGPLAPPFCISANRVGTRGAAGSATPPSLPPAAPAAPGGFALVPLSVELSNQLFAASPAR